MASRNEGLTAAALEEAAAHYPDRTYSVALATGYPNSGGQKGHLDGH